MATKPPVSYHHPYHQQSQNFKGNNSYPMWYQEMLICLPRPPEVLELERGVLFDVVVTLHYRKEKPNERSAWTDVKAEMTVGKVVEAAMSMPMRMEPQFHIHLFSHQKIYVRVGANPCIHLPQLFNSYSLVLPSKCYIILWLYISSSMSSYDLSHS